MQIPLEVTFRGLEKTAEIEDLIREKVEKLEQICSYLISCRIAVEKPQQHQRTGSPYRVRITMRVPPGHELVVSRDPGGGDLHDPLSKVLRNAFEAAARQLQELVEKERDEVKIHPEQETNAIVIRLFPEEGYGFLRDLQGKEVYFHENSVLNNGFERLETGTGVRFVESAGEKGPQASTVEIVDKPA